MADNQFQIGIVITGDDSQFKKTAASTEKSISDLGTTGQSSIGNLTNTIKDGAGALGQVAGVAAGAASAIAGIGVAAVGAGVAFFGLVKQASDYGSAIKDFQDKTGLAAETIGTLKLNAEQSGIEFDKLATPINKFTKLVGDAQNGSKTAIDTLKKFGIVKFDSLDNSLSTALGVIDKTTNSVDKSRLSMDAFGTKSGAVMRAVAANVGGNLNQAIEDAKRLGVVLSQEDVDAADNFGDTLHVLGVQAQVTSSKFLLQFAPQITDAMNAVSKKISENKDSIKDFGVSLSIMVSDAVKGFSKLIDKASQYGWVLDRLKLATSTVDPLAGYLIKSAEDYGKSVADRRANMADASAFVKPKKEGDGDGSDFVAKVKDQKPKELKSVTFDDILTAMRVGTAGQESSGGTNTSDNARTKATGMFQVTPANVAQWTKDTFGREFSVAEFKANTAAQIAIFNKYMGQYLKEGLQASGGDIKEGIRRAAVRWYGGSSDQYNQNWSPVPGKEPTRAQYTQSVANRTMAALGKRKGLDLPLLSNVEVDPAVKLLGEYDEKVKNLGVSSERARANLDLEKATYKNLTAAQREKVLADADEIDKYNKKAKASGEYQQYLDGLNTQYNELNGVEKTATGEFNKQIAAAKAAGVEITAAAAATEKKKAVDIDLAAGLVKLNSLEGQITAARIADAEATMSQAAAQQNLRNEIDKTQPSFTDKYGVHNPDVDARAKAVTSDDNASVAPDKNKTFGAGLANGLGVEKFKTQADAMGSTMQKLGATGAEAFNGLASAIGSVVQNWVLYGNASGENGRKAVASALAAAASQSAVSAIMETAYGLAALTPWGAAIYGPANFHFQSAALFATVAAGTAGLGRAVAGNSLSQGGASGSSDSTTNPSEQALQNGSNNQQLDFLRSSQNDTNNTKQNALQVKAINDLTNTVADLHNKISSMPAGDVVTAGIRQRPGLIGNQAMSDLKKNSTTATEFGRTLRIK